jgi:outer membrane receptor protein involved in Fe transport
MVCEGRWDATDQIPRRAVEEGLIGRFGLLDPDLGGESSRYSLSGELHRRRGATLSRLSAYLMAYDLELLSNFTYFLDDPADGDQFLQLDDRIVLGARMEERRDARHGGRPLDWGYGLELRYDDIENGLFHTIDREVASTIRRDEVGQLLGGLWIDAEVPWSAKVRTRAGLRADYYRARVTSDTEFNSGTEDDLLASPKLSLVLGPWSRTEWYLNLGYGYHSNDARGATIRVDPRTGEPAEPVDPLVRARGADLGFRTNALRGLQSSVSFFVLDLDSELVFVGDAGGTEASRPSRRRGIEIANFYRPLPWLSLDLDLTFSDAEFTDEAPEGNEIPGAIESTVAAGVAVDRGGGMFGSLRWRYFGPRPLVEDGSVRSGSTSLVNARIGYAFRQGFTLGLEVFNLLNREDSDIEYFYASRLPGEPLEGIEDVHFHPMESRSFRLVAIWRLGS